MSDTYEYDTVKVVNLHRSVDGSARLVLSLARSNTLLLKQINNVRIYLFLASAASILIAGLLVFLSAGIMLRPLGKIISVAERINASNSIERVPVPNTRDENEKLAKTLNAMLSRIESSIKNQINFFASATHELKTPLTVMQTELSISLAKAKDPETIKILESQLSEVQRLDRIIHDFLLMSQLKSESLTIRKKAERLDEVVYASMKQLKYLGQERRAQIQVTLDDDDRTAAIFDFDKIQTVLTNLIENAVKYSPEQSIIRIIINDQTITILNPLVKPITDMNTLTAEFKKSEELSSGLGMGLWLCNQIVRLHGATLQLSQEKSEFIARVTFETHETTFIP